MAGTLGESWRFGWGSRPGTLAGCYPIGLYREPVPRDAEVHRFRHADLTALGIAHEQPGGVPRHRGLPGLPVLDDGFEPFAVEKRRESALEGREVGRGVIFLPCVFFCCLRFTLYGRYVIAHEGTVTVTNVTVT